MLSDVIKAVSNIVADADRWVVFGAVAANIYRAEERFTYDVDVLVTVNTEKLPTLIQIAARDGWTVTHNQSDWLLRLQHAHYGEVDIVRVEDDYQQQAMLRARAYELEGHTFHVLSPEDVIIHKMIADRAQDEADVLSIFYAEHPLDWDYLSQYIREWALQDRFHRIEQRYEQEFGSTLPRIHANAT